MNLAEIQLERDEWVHHNFPGGPPIHAFLGVVEEAGELAHHLLKRDQGIRGEEVDHTAEVKDACADLVIFLLGVASNEGFVLEDAIIETWMKVRERDWIKFPQNGVTA